MTKADEIRSMTDEQLSWFIWSVAVITSNLCPSGRCKNCSGKGILCSKDEMDDWLKSPVEKKGA